MCKSGAIHLKDKLLEPEGYNINSPTHTPAAPLFDKL